MDGIGAVLACSHRRPGLRRAGVVQVEQVPVSPGRSRGFETRHKSGRVIYSRASLPFTPASAPVSGRRVTPRITSHLRLDKLCSKLQNVGVFLQLPM